MFYTILNSYITFGKNLVKFVGCIWRMNCCPLREDELETDFNGYVIVNKILASQFQYTQTHLFSKLHLTEDGNCFILNSLYAENVHFKSIHGN